VEQYEEEHCKVCRVVFNLPASKGGASEIGGTLKPLLVPKWKWDKIAMDFILSLPKTPTGEDSIWVVVDRLMKSAHFIPIKVKDPMDKLAKLYV
jgi:hypothetical protein